MASYSPRPDGLLEVTLDDGRRMPTALDAGTLEAQGIYASPPMAEPPAMPDQRLAMGENMSQMPEAGMSLAPPGAADFAQPPMGPPLPPAAPTDQPMARPNPVTSAAGSPTAFVSEQFGVPAPAPAMTRVQMPGTGPAPQGPAGDPVDIGAMTESYFRGELAPRGGGPIKRIPAHDERRAFTLKYRQTDEDPQLAEDIGESRIDQQLARQDLSEQDEQTRAMQARLAAKDASDAQKQLERTLVRKQKIESDVGAKIQAIEDRFAKARAVTESGSARERVMKDKGWFGRILATIGVAMGAFAAGQTGGRNLVQDQLNKEVDEEAEREKQLYNIDPETSALKAYVDAWGTPQGAEQEYKLQLKNAALAKIEAWARRADAANVPIEFRNWLADESLKLQTDKKAVQDAAAAEVVEQYQRVPERVTGGAARPNLLKAAQNTAAFKDALTKAFGGKQVDPKEAERLRQLYVPGEGFAYSEAEAAKLRTGKQSKEELTSLADQALEIRKQYAERKISLYAAKQQLASNKGQALAAYKGVKQMGTLDQQTERVFNDIYGEIDALPSIVAERAGLSLGTERTKALKKNLEADWQKARTNQITTDPYGTQPARPSTPGSFQPR